MDKRHNSSDERARTPMLALFVMTVSLSLACASKSQPAIVRDAAPSPVVAPQIARPAGVLRVCADPNNLPFSNQREEGFENRIAKLVANDLQERLEYTWWAQRRGFFRNTLKAGKCDLVIGVPSGFEMASTTRPYYRSTYVFVSRKDHGLDVHSFDDARLRNLKIGVQMVGDDFSNTPPAHALTRRDIISNVKGFSLYGDYAKPNPPAGIIDAVARDDIEVAIVWGPLAGYFARQSRVPLQVTAVSPHVDQPFLPFVFDISMGVRRGDQELKDQLDQIIEKRHGEIENILNEFGVPRVDENDGMVKGD